MNFKERTGRSRSFNSLDDFFICLYEGGDRSHCTIVVGRDGTQLGISKELNGLIELKVLAKILVHVVTSKEGNSNVTVTEICQCGSS